MKGTLRRLAAGMLAAGMLLGGAARAEDSNLWLLQDREKLTIGNPTPFTGHFFTTMWGGTTSDLDIQALLHGYSPVIWDEGTLNYRFDHSVVQDAAVMEDTEGNRTYLIVLHEDLFFSDGTPITAYDYAFSVLLEMDGAVRETGGTPADFSWLAGSDEYLSGQAKTLTGVRILNDHMIQFTAKADSLPYFHEMGRLDIHPYPAQEIAPGISAADDGDGIYLTGPLTAEMLRQTVLDKDTGYLSHPRTVSGPYTLKSYDGVTAQFRINGYYKGNEEGYRPRIAELTYITTDNRTMIGQLESGEAGLLNKVTAGQAINDGRSAETEARKAYAFSCYPRTGLTAILFSEDHPALQELAVRKAIAYCLDREGFTKEYTASYGTQVDGLYGIGMWTYQLAAGILSAPGQDAEAGTDAGRTPGAWDRITLDGLTKYGVNIGTARLLLNEAGWNLTGTGEAYDAARGGTRHKLVDGQLVPLELTMGIPDDDDTEAAIQAWFLPNLEQAGIHVHLRRMKMSRLEETFRASGANGVDLIYAGIDFSTLGEEKILQPEQEETSGELSAAKAECYQLAREMARTEPGDLLSFLQKWVRLQVRITETLPVIPVYSNVYFDFYTRQLHGYRITEHICWSKAIVESYISDTEELFEGEEEEQLQEIKTLTEEFGLNQ